MCANLIIALACQRSFCQWENLTLQQDEGSINNPYKGYGCHDTVTVQNLSRGGDESVSDSEGLGTGRHVWEIYTESLLYSCLCFEER